MECVVAARCCGGGNGGSLRFEVWFGRYEVWNKKRKKIGRFGFQVYYKIDDLTKYYVGVRT